MEGGYGGLPRPPSGGTLLNFDTKSGILMGLDLCVTGWTSCMFWIGRRSFGIGICKIIKQKLKCRGWARGRGPGCWGSGWARGAAGDFVASQALE